MYRHIHHSDNPTATMGLSDIMHEKSWEICINISCYIRVSAIKRTGLLKHKMMNLIVVFTLLESSSNEYKEWLRPRHILGAYCTVHLWIGSSNTQIQRKMLLLHNYQRGRLQPRCFRISATQDLNVELGAHFDETAVNSLHHYPAEASLKIAFPHL